MTDFSDLNDPCRTVVREVINGDRHAIDDAESVEVVSDMDIKAVHKYRGYTVTLYWSLYNGWHDSDGPMQKFDPFEVEDDQ